VGITWLIGGFALDRAAVRYRRSYSTATATAD
jgi:hypothetical protein